MPHEGNLVRLNTRCARASFTRAYGAFLAKKRGNLQVGVPQNRTDTLCWALRGNFPWGAGRRGSLSKLARFRVGPAEEGQSLHS